MARRFWADNTSIPGEQFGYAFDNIGNRTGTASGTNSDGSLRTANYTPDSHGLNQYTSRTVPGGVDIMGIAGAQASVTVNGATTDRKGEFYHAGLTVNNSSAPAWLTATSTATLGNASSSVTGSLFVPQSVENYYYDNDGNLTSDGRFQYTWDAENRLIRVVSATSVGPQQTLWFDYDYAGRRIRKRVWNSTSNTNTLPTTNLLFVYDGWNPIAVLDANNNNALLSSYASGADLSGGVHGAGGRMGGLVSG